MTTNKQLHALEALADVALARGDVRALRDLLRNGSTFASFTIRQRTEVAERQFALWVAEGRPSDVRTAGIRATYTDKNRRLAGVDRLSDEDVLACFTLPAGVASMHLADRVAGFGPAKAGFALACAGSHGGTACMDSHLLRRHAAAVAASGYNPSAAARRTVKAGTFLRPDVWTCYFALVTAVYGSVEVSAHAQWEEWLTDFARSNDHGVLLQAQREVI